MQSNVIVDPKTVMVELICASVTVLTVFGVRQNVRFANSTVKPKLVFVELHKLVSFSSLIGSDCLPV